MTGAERAIRWLTMPVSEVSAHYVVAEDGRVTQLVPEMRRAWHVGRGAWGEDTDVNSASIGIEIVNPGHWSTRVPVRCDLRRPTACRQP
jgi:N-acetylmuramoyl-L-alanine amidase